jgi:hypothetical protein
MNLNLLPSTTLAEIQEDFQKHYPFLKICFASIRHGFGELVGPGHWYDPSFHLSALINNFTPKLIEIHPWQKTGEVEEMFVEIGLYAQVFRWEDDQWIETAGTDVLTLDEQNQIAFASAEKRSGNLWIEREALL